MRCKLSALLLLAGISLSQPITGEARKLEFRKDRIIYIGDVKLVRGEAVLRADRVEILLDEEGRPLRIVATGSVSYREAGRRASSDYAEYDLKREVILLRGKVRVEEEKNVLEADEIVYDRKSGTLQAKGKEGRVRTIYIEEEENEKVGHNQGDSPQEGNIPAEGEDHR